MLTELEAVNEILSALGQTPVNSLETSSRLALLALNELRSNTKAVQSEEWSWNTDPDRTLSADTATGEIRVPTGTLAFRVHGEPWMQLRDGRLYDRAKETFAIETAKAGHLVLILDWEDLPYAAQRYITTRSARKLYSSHVGSSDDGYQSLYREEMMARATCVDDDLRAAQMNHMQAPGMPIFHGSREVPGSPIYNPFL
jgi:hypothetical protein